MELHAGSGDSRDVGGSGNCYDTEYIVEQWRHLPNRRLCYTRVPLYFKSYAMSGPEKIRSRGLWSHIVS